MRKRKYLNPIKGPILNRDWGGGGFQMASSTLLEACVSFTNAEWLANTSKQLVAAPGAGNYYNILESITKYTYGTAVASGVTQTSVTYAARNFVSTEIRSDTTDSSIFFTQQDRDYQLIQADINTAMTAKNTVPGRTGGTGSTYKVCVLYTIEAL